MSTSKRIILQNKRDRPRRINRLLYPKSKTYNTYFTNQKDLHHLVHCPISPAHMPAAELDTADMLAADMIAGMMIVVVGGIAIVVASIPVDAMPSFDILEGA